MGIQGTIGLLILLVVLFYGGVISYITRALIVSPFRHFTVSPSAPSPFVSVVVPTRNEAPGIRDCLEGLKLQDFSGELFEIIVTDDFSEDYTVEIARNFARENPGLHVHVISGKEIKATESGKKSAIGRAVEVACGELILCTDADTAQGVHWISSMAKGYGNGKFKMVIGPVAFHHEKSLFQKIQALEFMGLIGTTAGAAGAGHPVMCNGANLAYSREAYMETGGFTNNLGYASGDDQFLMAAIGKKYGNHTIRFLFEKEAVVYTAPLDSLKGFVNQRLRWVSKSRGYREPAVIGLALLTYAVHLGLLGGMLTGIFFPKLLLFSLALWIVKILIEYPVVWFMARFLNKKKLLGYYFAAQVFQLFYVVLIGMLGNIIPYEWKGRRQGR